MSEKQTHTQGPWHAFEQNASNPNTKGLFEIDANHPSGNRQTIAVTPYKGDARELEANARLIAAAPEMYEVLKEIFRLSEIGLSNGILYGKKLVTEMGTENIPTHEKVRAILAKVEGETA